MHTWSHERERAHAHRAARAHGVPAELRATMDFFLPMARLAASPPAPATICRCTTKATTLSRRQHRNGDTAQSGGDCLHRAWPTPPSCTTAACITQRWMFLSRPHEPPCSSDFWFPKSLESLLRLFLVYCNTKDKPLQRSAFPIKIYF